MYYSVLFFCFFPSFFLIRLNAFLPCKIVKNPQKYTIYITWLYVKCQLTEKLKKTIDSVLVCSLALFPSVSRKVKKWKCTFMKALCETTCTCFAATFFAVVFSSLSFRLPLSFYIAFICCALSVLFHKAYQNGNGIFLESLFFSCWQATQQNPTHYTAPRVIKYMAQQ